jgi:TolB-like protein/Flp pilus assembly protein TadD
VLHRDLKPANVFLCSDGRVKLLDFGLAHLLGTRGVHGAGTPGYMAPEQLRGEAVDARGDVFALGATLFEALSGKRAFEVRESRSAALDEGPPPELPAGTPAPLSRLLERCLSRDPAARPASGQAIVEELLAVQHALDRAEPERRAVPARAPGAGRKLALGTLLAGAAVAVAGGAYLLAARGRPTTEKPGAANASPPSVAVLPFADMSPGKDQEYLGDGIAEEIINALTRVEGLMVVGRTSSFSFKGKRDDLREVGRKLGAGVVLEGSVRSAGSRVRITAQLVNAASGYHLWSATYDRELGDVLTLEDEIAQAVVDALRVRLASGSSPSPSARRTVAPEAYSAYLVGKQLLRRYNLSDFERARSAFEEAVALDPAYAPAWAGLAEATYWSSDYLPKLDDIRKGFDRALAAADRALALDPELAQGYATRGFVRAGARWDWAGALTDFERALRLNPGDAQVHRLYSHVVLRPLGRFPQAIAEARRATELDPLDANAWSTYAAACFAGGQPERALEAYDRSLVIQPEQDYAPSRKAMLLVSLGRPAEALSWAERSTSPLTRRWAIAIAAHSAGRAEASQRALERLVAENAEGAAYQVAWVFAMRGERDRAFEWLERAYEQHDSGLLFAKTDPLLRGLHGDPRFAAFLKKVGLPVP